MTQIRSIPLPSRRSGELGVHSLNHFALTVPDLTVADRFYRSFGLNVSKQGSGVALHTEASDTPWGLVIEDKGKRLHHLSFGIFEDDLTAFKRRLEERRIDLLNPPPGFESNGIWFRDHDGLLIEIRVGGKRSPDHKS